MRILILIAVVCLLGASEARSKKKSTKDDLSPGPEYNKGKHKKVPSAIIAIEIVDPNENKTSSRNHKRTIESALGYGYQQPKYEVYKYSQHDIPAYQGSNNLFSGYSGKSNELSVQKSISYTLPSQKYTQVDNANYYQPGTRLYSTLDQQGHVGQLSSDVPHNQQGSQVPVIILRVFPNQLADAGSSLHANLPKSHPFASNINSIDIQSLLNNYIQTTQHHVNPYVAAYMNTPALYPQQQQLHQQQQQEVYQQPIKYQQQEQAYQYEQPKEDTKSLLTHENYPSDSHTRVVFKDDQGKIRDGQSEKTINIHLPSDIKEVQVEESDVAYQTPQQQQQQPQQQQEQYDSGNYYYYQQGQQQLYEQPQQPAYEEEQQQYQQYENYQQSYSGQPIVAADPQAYQQQYEPQQQQYEQPQQQQQEVQPHQLYGQPNEAQYQASQQQYYNAPAEVQIVPRSHTKTKRKIRTKKRMAPRPVTEKTTDN